VGKGEGGPEKNPPYILCKGWDRACRRDGIGEKPPSSEGSERKTRERGRSEGDLVDGEGAKVYGPKG